MVDFLMLGQIPGTSIYINFASWLVMALLAATILAVRYDQTHDHRLLLTLIYLSLRWQLRQPPSTLAD